jgi:cytochrome b561
MLKNSQENYGSIAKFFHWLIFFLIFCMIPLGYFMEDIGDKALRGQIINIHKLTGLSILVLMILRAAWAFINVKPHLPLGTPQWQLWLERSGHFLLYVVIIAMPIAGWVGSVAAGYIPHLFDWKISLPIAKSEALSDVSFSVHNTLAIIIIVFVSLHVLAALYHHVVKKDDVLKRML